MQLVIKGLRVKMNGILTQSMAQSVFVEYSKASFSCLLSPSLSWPQVMLMRDHPHENIVQFHDSYLVQDELWVVMEYLDGGALTTIVQRSR